MSGMPEDLRDELLDDFYAESDELLGAMRNALVQLEQVAARGEADAGALEALYRSTHTFKGNCAIIGLAVGEKLAHAAEGLLRSLSRSRTTPASDQLGLVAEVVQRLESCVAQRRRHQALPEISDLLARLDADEPGPGASSVVARSPAAVTGALRWRAMFSPAPELDRRGVNVTAIRARLAELGEMVSATPTIRPGGKVVFTFVLALRAAPADPAGWERDGVVFEALAAEPTPATPVEAASDRAGEVTAPGMFITPSHIVRVNLGQLDNLMRIVGEMVIHRSRLEERIARLEGDRSELREVNTALGRSLRELREAVSRVRLVPVAEIFSRLPFVVRDLARETGKEVRLFLEGQDTEFDKYLVERLKEPLLHLVRNAISHGVETPAEREAAGKPREASLTLSAAAEGQQVVIRVRDDGRGIAAETVLARARAAGLALPEAPTPAELLGVICQPGFSTRDQADRAAGRGVGMSVVHNTVRELSGTLTLETRPGEGTVFTLRLPLTLAIADTFLVVAGDQTCAVPQAFVDEIVEIDPAEIRSVQNAEVVSYREGVLPLVHLRGLFSAPASTLPRSIVLVLSSERGWCGLVVDKVLGQREVVVRAMRDPLIQVAGVSGATELGDGRPVLILDPVALSQGALRPRVLAGARTERKERAS